MINTMLLPLLVTPAEWLFGQYKIVLSLKKIHMQISKAVLFFNILPCAILLGDAFVFPPEIKTVPLMEFSSKYTRLKSARYSNYFIHTGDNCRYEVSQSIFDVLKEHDTIQIFSSRLIGMPLSIGFKSETKNIISNIGQLRTKDSASVGLVTGSVLSLIVLLLELLNRKKGIKLYFPLYFLSLAITLVAIVVVIIEKIMI